MLFEIVDEYSKLFKLGKIAFKPYCKIKANSVEIEVRLTVMSDGSYRFACAGDIWNHLRTDVYSCGQNQDTIKKLLETGEIEDTPLIREILNLWDTYHLKSFSYLAPKQEQAVQEAFTKGILSTGGYYEDQIECFLEDRDLLVVEHNGKPHKYGEKLVWSSIPEDVIERIISLIDARLF